MKKGKFIVFEGLDGCGKTTQLEKLRSRLVKTCSQKKCFATREPSDSVPGLICRGASKETIFVKPETLALLFAADRNEHIIGEIMPQLDKGNHVICDRYYFSNFAYQSDQTEMGRLFEYNAVPFDLLRPDITIFIDVPPEECERRRAAERATDEKFENIEKAKNVLQQYKKAFELLPDEKILLIDGMASPDEIFEQLWLLLTREENIFEREDLV